MLWQAEAAKRFTLTTPAPPPELMAFVEYYWIVRWDLRDEPEFEQAVLPHPNVHLAFEASGAAIHGVDRSLFTRKLSGLGKALGIRFWPGGFRPFWGAPVSELTDLVIPAADVFGPAAEQARTLIMDPDAADADMTRHAGELLLASRPAPDVAAEQASDLVARITGDPSLRRVSQLTELSGLSARALQRLFAEYVGVTPKWVMRRARLHDAAQRADSGAPVDWGRLAADLGYSDQAHLTRDFTRTLGVPPSRYRRPLSHNGRGSSAPPLPRPAEARPRHAGVM